jgi:hypothetical protein
MQILPLYNGVNVPLFPVQGQGCEFGNSNPGLEDPSYTAGNSCGITL